MSFGLIEIKSLKGQILNQIIKELKKRERIEMLNLQNSLSLLLNGMRMTSSGGSGNNNQIQQKGASDSIAPGHPLGASNLLGNGPYRTPLPAEVMSQNAKT